MKNLSIELRDEPGALAEMGEIVGRAGVSIEGGGAFAVDGRGVANFLFEDGAAARQVLESAGIRVLEESDVVVQELNQEEPGQLGKILQRMAAAGVNIRTQYSDHHHRLVLVVDEAPAARRVSEAWTQERQEAQSAPRNRTHGSRKSHDYAVQVTWTGNSGVGTKSYTSYRRDHAIEAAGKPSIQGSSDPAFRGDPQRHNPEELLVASLSSCHMLGYLHLCAISGVNVLSYRDAATGVMEERADGAGAFVRVDLTPAVAIAPGSDPESAALLHEEAHRKCFIANSVSFPVRVSPHITVAGEAEVKAEKG